MPAISAGLIDRPVTLPPGRARTRDHAGANRVPAVAKTIGMAKLPALRGDCRASRRDDDIHLEPDELSGDLGKPLAAPLRPAILDRDGAALDPAELTQPLHKCGSPLAPVRRRASAEESDGRQLRRLLRPRRQRPRRRRAAEQRDELAPPHIDHLVGTKQKCLRNRQADCLGRSKVDTKVKLGWEFYR